MHDGLWNGKFAKLSIVFIFLELKFAMFAVQVFDIGVKIVRFKLEKDSRD